MEEAKEPYLQEHLSQEDEITKIKVKILELEEKMATMATKDDLATMKDDMAKKIRKLE